MLIIQAGATKVASGTMLYLAEKYSVATGRKSVAFGTHSTIMIVMYSHEWAAAIS